jgi:MFS family permease
MSENTPLMSNGLNASTEQTWKPGKNFRWIQLATMFNVFLMGFDQTIAASTYAVIGSEFQSMNQVSWISTSYLITSTAFQPLYGYFLKFRGPADERDGLVISLVGDFVTLHPQQSFSLDVSSVGSREVCLL